MVDVYVHKDDETMYETGIEIGLEDEALEKFCYALYELRMTLEVNLKTGDTRLHAVDGQEVHG